MRRYHCIGVAGLVALMAAHREAIRGNDKAMPALDQDAVARINAYLRKAAQSAHARTDRPASPGPVRARGNRF